MINLDEDTLITIVNYYCQCESVQLFATPSRYKSFHQKRRFPLPLRPLEQEYGATFKVQITSLTLLSYVSAFALRFLSRTWYISVSILTENGNFYRPMTSVNLASRFGNSEERKTWFPSMGRVEWGCNGSHHIVMHTHLCYLPAIKII